MFVSIYVNLSACRANQDAADSWPWQSNGNCTNHCNDLNTYAFAVLQYQDCWCTNYIPSTTTDITRCQRDCPGFPAEKCGNKDAGLFMYIEMNGKPSGTAGGGSQPSSTDVSSTTAVPSTDSPSSSDVVTVSTSMSHYVATA